MDKEHKSLLRHIWWMLLLLNVNLLALSSIVWKIYKKE